MTLVITQLPPPEALPVSVAELKAYQRVSHAYEDAILEGAINAAREVVEGMIGRTLIETHYELRLDGFPHCIVLPKSPVMSVGPIVYDDINDQEQTTTAFEPRTDANGVTILYPAHGSRWPNVAPGSPVTVPFVAGYTTDDAPDAIPADVKSAILMIAGGIYSFREPMAALHQGQYVPAPTSVEALLARHRRIVV